MTSSPGNDERERNHLRPVIRRRPYLYRQGIGAASVAVQEVKEDPEFYVPDLLSEDACELDSAAYSAADAHAGHLRKAEGWVHDAQNLARVLRASVQTDGDRRAAEADTVLKIIESRLRKISRAIDRHGRRHSNLFLAYVALRRDGKRPIPK